MQVAIKILEKKNTKHPKTYENSQLLYFQNIDTKLLLVKDLKEDTETITKMCS